jgi:hypothetical protein
MNTTMSLLTLLECTDIANLIFDLLDAATISGVAPVCKRFTELSHKHYETRINNDLLIPAKLMYDDFYEKTIRLYISNKYRYFLNFTAQLRNFLKMLYEFERFIEPFINKNYWVLFVYDLNIMEKMFLFISRLNEMMEDHRHQLFFYTNVSQDNKDLYYRLQSIFDIMDDYMYVEYPDRYLNIELHRMARFKQIKQQYKMKRSRLIKALKRPNDEVYYFQYEHPHSNSCAIAC